MRATLPGEVERFLRRHGPSTAKGIALGIRARRDDVGRVVRVADAGGDDVPTRVAVTVAQHAKHPLRPTGKASIRAQDTSGHVKVDAAGRRTLRRRGAPETVGGENLIELRGAGYDVRHRWIDGEVFYWIEKFPAASEGDESPLEAA